jgi:hypothetical protein
MRLIGRSFTGTPRAEVSPRDSKHDTIVTSSGSFNVLVATRRSSPGTESGLKS